MFIPALKTAATHLHHQIFSQSNVPLSLMYSFFLPHRAFYPRYLYAVLSSNRGKCQGNTYLLGSSSRFLLAFTLYCIAVSCQHLLYTVCIAVSWQHFHCTYVLLFLASIYSVWIAAVTCKHLKFMDGRCFLLAFTVYGLSTVSCQNLQCMDCCFLLEFTVYGLLFLAGIYSV